MALFYIKTYAVNVSWGDDITVAPLFDKVYTGHLSFADLFAVHVEHRMPFPYLIELSLGVLTHHNNVVECYLSWLLICIIACVFLGVLIEAFGTKKAAFMALIPIVWLLFTWQQLDTLLFSFERQYFMVMLFFLFAIYLLAKSTDLRWRLALSVACGVISTFSVANGLLVWPIGLILILWMRQSQPRESRRLYLKMGSIWCLVGIAVFVSYLHGYHDNLQHLKMEYLMHHPLSAARFFVAAIGDLFRGNIHWAYAAGLILLPLYAWAVVTIVFKNKARLSTALGLSLILFALGSAALLTWGRSFYGPEAALTNRYVTVMVSGVVGLYLVIVSPETKYTRIRPWLLGILVSLIIVSIIPSYVNGKDLGGKLRNTARTVAYIEYTYNTQSDESLQMVPYNSAPLPIREWVAVLEKHGLSVFSTPGLDPAYLTPVEGSTQFYIYFVSTSLTSSNQCTPSNQQPCIFNLSQNETTLNIWGNAIDQQANNTAGGVFVNIDGQIDIPALYGSERPDVAARLGERYRYSGFSASFATSVVGYGQHILTFKIVTKDKKGYYEPDQKIVLELK